MTQDDHALARELATEAGALLLRLRADRGFADIKALRDAGDRESHLFLMEALKRQRPGDTVLCEEGRDDALPPRRRAGVDRRPAGRHPGVRRGGPQGLGRPRGALGAVGTLTAGRGRAARAGPYALHRRAARGLPDARHAGHIRGRGEPHPAAGVRPAARRPPRRRRRARADRVGGRQDRRGAHSARSTPTCTPAASTNGTRPPRSPSPWRSAPTPRRIDGSPLVYNQEDPKLPDILVCHPELAPTLLAGIRAVL